ncbi:MAG TPA: hypothetical protein VGS22_24585 [Thermoanaerobaculia bacterium]|jgi:hypothetical protein|nr:hypothetical protein [Thermoanaerobaculia bacterium]
MTSTEQGLDLARRLLRVGFGLMAFLAGLDKFFNLLTNWDMYLAPWMANLLPVSSATFFGVIGVIEMVAGLLVLTKWPRLGAYIVSAWLLAIALQLVSTGMFYDLAVRDIVLSLGAFALAKLTEWRAAVPAR